MQSDDERISLDQFLASLEKLSDSGIGAVLVAGQAVNLWAEHYASRVSLLLKFRPFVSKDVDLFGVAEDLQQISQVLDGDLVRYKDVRQSVIGTLTTRTTPALCFELLRTIYGPITGAQILSRAHQIGSILVIDPVSLLISKCCNTASLDQEQRQDLRHAMMMAVIVKEFFADLVNAVDEKITPRQLIKELRYLLDFSEDAQFQKGLKMAEHSLRDCLPLEELAELGERFPAIGRFIENTLSTALESSES